MQFYEIEISYGDKKNMTNSKTPEDKGPGKLGTFAGVFTPSVLTILGIILVLRTDAGTWERLVQTPVEDRHIDVWWKNDATSRLMLLFAYLMKRTKPWDGATIRVLTKGTGSNFEIEKNALSQVLEDVRIEAKAKVKAEDVAKTAEEVIDETILKKP